jgi:hypothetical protein
VNFITSYHITSVFRYIRQGRKRRKLLDDLKERRGYSHLKEEALDSTIWRARFGRGFGPVVRQTTKWMNCTVYYTNWPPPFCAHSSARLEKELPGSGFCQSWKQTYRFFIRADTAQYLLRLISHSDVNYDNNQTYVDLKLRIKQLTEIWHTFCRTFYIPVDRTFNWNAGMSNGFIIWLIRIYKLLSAAYKFVLLVQHGEMHSVGSVLDFDGRSRGESVCVDDG